MILFVLAVLSASMGAALLFGEHRWFRRLPRRDRLAPYLPGAHLDALRRTSEADDLVTVLTSAARVFATRTAAALGVREDVAVRLERVHSAEDPDMWRVRQVARSLATFAIAAVVVGATRPPLPITALLLVGGPALAFLVHEQQLSRSSERWQRRLFLELPVVAEQLGMLLSAGHSVGAAIDRVARRANGACAADLERVGTRIRHGVDEHAALHEWATLSDVPAVHRLVDVLALDREAADLGRLITEEARAHRREVHRELIETIERRGQQVWIPVTVATLVPGVLFLAVPFAAALQLFAGS